MVITNVKRSQMGQYICMASNSEGEGESKPMQLEIQCKCHSHALVFTVTVIAFFSLCCFYFVTVAPVCRAGQIHTYNVGRGETAKIQCEVMGVPTDINFVWKFNTSVSELLDMPSSIVTNDKTRSTIHFKPMTEHVIIATKCHCDTLSTTTASCFCLSVHLLL